MNLSDTAKQLIKELGGHENVIDVTHCMTRLRFRLKNEDIVDDAKVKSLSGVLGVSRSGGQYQVIIGNAVATYYRAVTDVLGISGHTENTAPVSAGKKKWTAKRFFGNIIDAISGSVAPILPAIIGCGMIKLLLIILGLLGVPDTNMTYRVLEIVGDAAFYFLPIMVAYTAAKKFGCNPVLAMTLTGLLLHPDLIALFSAIIVQLIRHCREEGHVPASAGHCRHLFLFHHSSAVVHMGSLLCGKRNRQNHPHMDKDHFQAHAGSADHGAGFAGCPGAARDPDRCVGTGTVRMASGTFRLADHGHLCRTASADHHDRNALRFCARCAF